MKGNQIVAAIEQPDLTYDEVVAIYFAASTMLRRWCMGIDCTARVGHHLYAQHSEIVAVDGGHQMVNHYPDFP